VIDGGFFARATIADVENMFNWLQLSTLPQTYQDIIKVTSVLLWWYICPFNANFEICANLIPVIDDMCVAQDDQTGKIVN
jgi:hypothetical protein